MKNLSPLLALAVVSLVAATCQSTSPTPSPSSDASNPFSPPPAFPSPPAASSDLDISATAWGSEAANLQADGTRSTESALRLFALAFGDMPGVSVERDGATIPSGSLAIRAVMAHWDELTADQRAFVDAALTVPADSLRVEVGPLAEGSRHSGSLAMSGVFGGFDLPALSAASAHEYPPEVQDALRETARKARAYVARKMGADIPGQIIFNFVDCGHTEEVYGCADPLFHGPAGRESEVTRDGPGAYGVCDVWVTPLAISEGYGQTVDTMVHEVFHCFQAALYSSFRRFDKAPAWVIEGGAEWVGNDIAQNLAPVDGWYKPWFFKPRTALFERTYDAVGFWAHLDESGISPYAVFPAVFRLPDDNVADFEATGAADTPDFLNSWASSVTRQAGLGRDWDSDAWGITSTAAVPEQLRVSKSPVETQTEPFTARVYRLNVTADVLTIAGSGHARLSDGKVDTREFPKSFCVKEEGCAPCPDSGNQLPMLGPGAWWVLTGGELGATYALQGKSLKEACEDEPEPSEASCEDGCAMSNGDPHIVTVDGARYEFQAAGEFILLRSADSSFEIQARQEPHNTMNIVSVNTAIAIKAGSQRINVLLDRNTKQVHVTVDGSPVDVSQPLDVDGVTLSAKGTDTYQVDFENGGHLYVNGLAGIALNLAVALPDSLRGDVVGVMGPIPLGSGLPALPDGTALPLAMDLDTYFQSVYGTFADAWRVTMADSLFDYAPGTSTDSYSVPNFPVNPVTLDGLTPEQKQAGEAACASVSVQFLHEQCVLDVALTGESGFASVYDLSAKLVETGALPASQERVRVVNLYADDSGPKNLDVYAWTGDLAVGDRSKVAGALIASVPYGQASEWLDPGVVETAIGEAGDAISVQVQGQSLNEFHLNLVDLETESAPGTSRTIVVASPNPDQAGGLFGAQATTQVYWETSPSGYPMALQDAPPEGALLFVDATGIQYTLPEAQFLVSGGKGCLSQPDFAGLAQLVGPYIYNGPLAIDPGDHEVSLHAGQQSDDPFAVKCDDAAIGDTLPLSIEASRRTFLFLYAAPGESVPHALIAPFGE